MGAPGQTHQLHHHAGAHAHAHGDGHGHSHAPTDFGRSFAIGIGLNLAFVGIETIYGFVANSMSLLADAGHNLSDVLGLVVAWAGAVMARRAPSPRFTYGLKKAPILAALANSLFLLVAVGAIGAEAVRRLFHPSPTEGGVVIVVAAIGIVVNGLTAMLFVRGQHDINVRGAFLHMLADAGVSVAVIAAAVGIIFTGWQWLDPAASLLISAVILWGTWRLLREAIRLSLNAAPREVDPHEVRNYLQGLPQVASLHDLHIWAMSTRETALSCHLVLPGGHPGDDFLRRVAHDLHDKFDIDHPTLQVELGDAAECQLRCEVPA